LIRIALISLLLTACSGLEPLTPSCGNGVVEPGEDCDSGASCRACSIVCTTDACPDGYACGADQLCHAPGGRFQQASTTISFEALGFGITDVNQDGYGDVVSLGGTSLNSYYGDPNATLTNQLHLITPELFSAPAVTHLDSDPTLDLVLPTADGLLAYTSPFEVPSPYAFPIEVSGGVGGPRELYVFPLDGPYLGLLLDDRMGNLALSIIDGTLKSDIMSATTPPVTVCAGMSPASVEPHARDTYATPSSHLLALTSMAGAICEVEVSGPTNAITSHMLGSTTTPGTTALFARLEPALACPSVLVATSTAYAELHASGVPGSCTTAASTPIFSPGALIGRVPLGAGVPDALASTAGIFTLLPSGAPSSPFLYATVRPFDAVQIVDINGDGLDDVIISSTMFDDLAVLVRYGSGASGGFLAQTIDTTGVPLNIVTGDFDGDGVGDVTYTEKLANGERLMIAFGGHDAIQEPRFVSVFTNVVEATGIGLRSSTDPNGDRVRDLIVLDRPIPDQETLLLSVLYGSPQRTLLPFFDPRPSSRIAMSYGMRGTIAGDFGHSAGSYKELFAIEESGAATATHGTFAYLIEPDSYGAMSVAGTFASPNIEVCSNVDHDGLCIDGANFVTYRENASSSHDLVVGLDTSALYHAVAFDPSGLALMPPQLPMTPISLVQEGLLSSAVPLFPHQLYVADIDGDGTNELVAGYAPTGPNDVTLGAVIACHPGSDGTISCFAPALDGWTCSAMAPANVIRRERFDAPVTRTSRDFVAICMKAKTDPHPELVHFWYDAGAYHGAAMFELPVNARYVESGDITGDGVDDILVFAREPQTATSTAIPLLHVYAQCTSRQAANCPPLDSEAR
jgi:hypothetical protein